MNVLSLFDGISTGKLALERAGLKVDNYYSSEIDKFCLKISQQLPRNTSTRSSTKFTNKVFT